MHHTVAQKSPVFLKRALYFSKEPCIWDACLDRRDASHSRSKEPCISQKSPVFVVLLLQRCITQPLKRALLFSKEPCICGASFAEMHHTAARKSSVFLERALHSTKRDLNPTKRAIHSTKSALNSTKRALHSTKRALHSTKRALHSTKRALHSTKRALYSIKRAFELCCSSYRTLQHTATHTHCNTHCNKHCKTPAAAAANVRACIHTLCSVLQCVAGCCSALQCVAVCCSALQCGAV